MLFIFSSYLYRM